MIINDATKLGSGGSNLILETAGKVYIKVADRFYELDFKNQGNGDERTISVAPPVEAPEIDMSQYVTKKYLRSTLANYITQRGWEDIQETKRMLENALLDGFTESINPVTVETMQLIVGTESLQFDFIDGLLTGNPRGAGFELMEGNSLRCPDNYIKHLTIDGPSAVRPETPIQYYSRWTVKNTSDDSNGNTYLEMPEDDLPYYVYIRAPKYINEETQKPYTDAYVEEHLEDDPKGSGIATYLISQSAIELETNDDSGYYYFLVAIVTSKSNGFRSIGYMNGFTEIVPGQITAYVFKTPDGTQYLDFLNEQFKIGNSESGLDWNVTTEDTLTVKGNMEVIGGPLREELDELEEAIADDYLKKVIKDGRTTVQGGLILSNVIALGHSTVPASDPTYWEHFTVESGISGFCEKYSQTEGYYDIAAWYGGKMIDGEKDSITASITANESVYSRNENLDRQFSFYQWSKGANTSDLCYTATSSPSVGSVVYSYNDSEISQLGTVEVYETLSKLNVRNSGHPDDRPVFKHYPSGDYYANDNKWYYCWKETTNQYGTYRDRYTTDWNPTVNSTLYDFGNVWSWGDDPPEVDSSCSIYSISSTTDKYIKVNDRYYLKESNTLLNINLFGWNNDQTYVYTNINPPEIGNNLWIIFEEVPYITSDVISNYDRGFASSIFRMNGSGYLSKGDISWDTNGNLTANKIIVKSGSIGGLLINENGIFNNAEAPTISITSNSAILSNAIIGGALSTRVSGSGEENFIALSDQKGSPIIRINGASLDTDSVPTYLYLDHGDVVWSGTVGQWFTYYNWDGEAVVLKRVRARANGTLVIPQFSGKFWLFGKGMTPWGNLKFYVKTWVNNNPVLYTVKEFDTFYGSASGVNNSFVVPEFTMDIVAGQEYVLCLYSKGALESGINTSTGFSISVDTTTMAYFTYNSDSETGVFIGANGLNLNMAKNSGLVYLVPKVTFNGGTISSDRRGNGGIFRIMLPRSSSSSTDPNNSIGIEISSYASPSGDTTTPAIKINLDGNWRTLTTSSSGATPLYLAND